MSYQRPYAPRGHNPCIQTLLARLTENEKQRLAEFRAALLRHPPNTHWRHR
jgi:hypothetical protein